MGLPAHLTNQDITVYPKSGFNEYGRETFGAAVTYKARVQETTKSRLLANGQTITVEAIAFIDSNPSIAANDKVVYGGVDYKVHGRYVSVDGQGNEFLTRLELVKWKL